MFKKLKDKIAEEVKISPQRIQQFTQSVTDKLQSNGSNDESFFSITEDDVPQRPPAEPEPGFTNVSLHASTSTTPLAEARVRRYSNSSMASDVSFLPRYEPSVNTYHLQSDIEASASELEDNASSSSQLGHVSKEQVYSAFQKAQVRYHKYRGRYTDLATHYKELERENMKMKAVLVETQDKAIRRASELREQCTLSQRAKADLEQALRTELEEKQIVISTLKDKVDLLQNCEASGGAETEALRLRVQELKAGAIVLQSREAEHRERLATLEALAAERGAEVAALEERERANNLKFAKGKMELHAELQSRDLEIAGLKDELEGHGLKAMNTKLIEKCETLWTKCQAQEGELVKAEQYRLEIAELQRERSDMRREMENLGAAVEEGAKAAQAAKAVVEALLQDKTEENDRLNDALREAENHFKEVKKANDNLRKSLEDCGSSAEETERLRIELNDCKAKVNELELSSKAEVERHTEECEKVKEQTKQSLLSLEAKIKTKLEGDFGQEQERMRADFERKLAELEASGEDGKRTQVRLVQSEERAQELAAALEKLRPELEKRSAAYRELEANHLGLIEENNGRQVEVTGLRREIGVLCSEKAERSEQAGKEAERWRKIEEELEAEKQQLQAEREANFKVKQHYVGLSKDLSKLSSENASLKDNIEDLHSKISKISDERNELKFLQDGCVQLKSDHENLLRENEIALSSLKLLQISNEKVLNERNELQAQNAILLGDCQKLNDGSTKLMDDCRTLKNDCDEFKHQNVRLLENLKTLQEEKQKELDAARQELAELQEKSASMHAKISKLLDENTLVTQKNADLSTQLERLKKHEKLETSEHLATIERLNREISGVQFGGEVKIKKLKERCAEIEGEKLSCEERVQEIEAKFQSIVDENRNLEIEISDLREIQVKFQLIVDENRNLEIEVSDLREIEAKYKSTLDENHNLKEEVSQLEALQSKISVLNDDIDCKTKETEVLREEIVRLKNDAVNFDICKDANQKLTEELAKLRGAFNEVSMQKQEATERYERLQLMEQDYNNLSKASKSDAAKLVALEHEIATLRDMNAAISSDNQELMKVNDQSLADLMELKAKYEDYEQLSRSVQTLADENKTLAATVTSATDQNMSLREQLDKLLESAEPTDTECLQSQISDFNGRYCRLLEDTGVLKRDLAEARLLGDTVGAEKRRLETQLSDLERHCGELQHEKQLLKDEVEELKTSPLNLSEAAPEVDQLRAKLAQYKSIDAANRSSIEFYEDELQKMRNKNERLNTKLDETLVTLRHCADLSSSTEVEYLKNVLYSYMLGKESVVMARVLAAICKFDPQQTEAVLKHEQHKQSLFGQLGIL